MTVIPDSPQAEVLHWLPLDQFRVIRQVRKTFDSASIEQLAENIKAVGIQQPLLCYQQDGETFLLDGERRLRAGKIAGLTRLPARIIADKLEAEEILIRQISCNIQRSDLNLLEKAEGIRDFMATAKLTGEQAAKRLGLSPGSVCKTLAVLRLPQPLQDRAASGELSAEAAYLLVRIENPDQQAALAQRVIAGELSRDGLASAVRAASTQAADAPPRPSTPAPAQPKTSVWRMTRSIGFGVALAVTGTGLTLDQLVLLLEAFLARAREAMARGVTVARFLSEFRYDAAKPSAGKGATA